MKSKNLKQKILRTSAISTVGITSALATVPAYANDGMVDSLIDTVNSGGNDKNLQTVESSSKAIANTAIAVLTVICIVAFAKSWVSLGVNSENPMGRKSAIMGICFSAFSLAGLGALAFWINLAGGLMKEATGN